MVSFVSLWESHFWLWNHNFYIWKEGGYILDLEGPFYDDVKAAHVNTPTSPRKVVLRRWSIHVSYLLTQWPVGLHLGRLSCSDNSFSGSGNLGPYLHWAELGNIRKGPLFWLLL